jgi:hypothetical protein
MEPGVQRKFPAGRAGKMLFGYLGPGMARGGAILAQQQILIVALAIFVLSNPGRAMGLDGVFFSGGKGKAPR